MTLSNDLETPTFYQVAAKNGLKLLIFSFLTFESTHLKTYCPYVRRYDTFYKGNPLNVGWKYDEAETIGFPAMRASRRHGNKMNIGYLPMGIISYFFTKHLI